MTKAERKELKAIADSAERLRKKLSLGGMATIELTAHATYIRCELDYLIGTDKP